MLEHLFATLTWETEDEMSPDKDACSVGALDGLDAGLITVPPLDTLKAAVARALYTVLHEEEGALRELLEVVEEGLGHAVRARADDEPDDVFMTECLLVLRDAVLHLPVGIGVGLEVSEVLHLGVLPAEEGDAFVDLLGDALELRRVVRAEALIVAVGTASLAHRSVTGGAGEACSERDLLHLLSREMALEEGGEVYVGEGRACG